MFLDLSFVHWVIYETDDYYNPKFHFCEPDGGPKSEPESLGSILFGDRIFNSPYDVCATPFEPVSQFLTMPYRSGCCRTMLHVKHYAGSRSQPKMLCSSTNVYAKIML